MHMERNEFRLELAAGHSTKGQCRHARLDVDVALGIQSAALRIAHNSLLQAHSENLGTAMCQAFATLALDG